MLRDENDEENYILDWSGADMVEFFFFEHFSINNRLAELSLEDEDSETHKNSSANLGNNTAFSISS